MRGAAAASAACGGEDTLGHDDDAPAAHCPHWTACSIQAGRDSRGSFSGTWPASTPVRPTLAAMKAAFPHVVLCFIPPHSTSYLQPCDVAVFRSFKSCIQTQASATLARSVIDGSFEGLAMEQSMAAPVFGRMGSSRRSRTSATRTRRGQLGGVACVPTAMPTSKKPRRGRGTPRPR